MKSLTLLVLFTAAAFAQGPRTVYLLAMSGGMDQYLASSLTHDHVMQVVTDPKLADLVLTDTLGEGFERKMDEIRPRATANGDQENSDTHPAFRSNSSRGTLFLVDAKTRSVVWSSYEKAPRTRAAGDMNRTAVRIAKKLQSTFGK